MKVFITRPEKDAAPLAAAFAEAGFEPVMTPLMTIEMAEGPAPALDGVQALAFTSANGVRAYGARGGCPDLRAYAVGTATAAALREAGFSDIRVASGDAASLAALISGECDPAAGLVLHLAGEAVAGDLVGALGNKGFVARREVLYRAVPVPALPDPLRSALEQGAGNGPGALVTFFSPRTARIAVDLIRAAGLGAGTAGLGAVCLSPAVARIVQESLAEDLQWGAVAVADQPYSAAMIAAAQGLAVLGPHANVKGIRPSDTTALSEGEP